MARPLLPLILIGALALATPSCAVWQAYANRAAIQQAQFSLRSVQITGLDLVGVNVVITVELDNPTSSPIEVDRLDYALFVNDHRACQGATPLHLTVPPRQSRPLPLAVSIAYADMGTQLRQLLVQRRVESWRLEGTAHFDTPFGPLDYPLRVTRREPGT